MRVALRLPAVLLALTVLWVALWHEVSVANVVGGLLVAVFVTAVARPDPIERPGTRLHPVHALLYVVRLGWKLVQATLRLAWEILTPRNRTYTGIIAVPMRGGSDDVVTLVANSITLTPGTLTVDVKRDGEGVVLYVHGMYTRDVEVVRRDVLHLEALALRAFGTNEEADRATRDLERFDAEHPSELEGEER